MNLPFSLSDVVRITAYKRDEFTTDLICWDVETTAEPERATWFIHEQAPDWKEWVAKLSTLPSLDCDRFAKVSKPTFAFCELIIFERSDRVEVGTGSD